MLSVVSASGFSSLNLNLSYVYKFIEHRDAGFDTLYGRGVNSLFPLFSLVLSMGLIAEGKVDLFNALTGTGSACGAFLGPLLAENSAFLVFFLLVALSPS